MYLKSFVRLPLALVLITTGISFTSVSFGAEEDDVEEEDNSEEDDVEPLLLISLDE